MIVRAFALSLSFFAPFFLFAELPTSAIRTAIETDIQQFKFKQAEGKLAELPAEYRYFYAASIDAYRYVCVQSPVYAAAFLVNWNKAIVAAEKLPVKDPIRGVLLSELQGKRAAMEFIQTNYLTAVWHLRACRNHILENEAKFPTCVENNKVLAVFNILFSAIPSKYQWITNSIGAEGDMKKGLQQLDIAINSGTLLPYETQFVAYHIDKNLLLQLPVAINRLTAQRKKNGKSIILDFLLASSYLNEYQTDAAIEVLLNRNVYSQDEAVFFIPYWDYLLGKAYYYNGRNDLAQVYFQSFLAAHKGTVYRSDAMFRLGLAATLTGNYPQGQKAFAKLATNKVSGWDEDEYAMYMAEKFAKKPPTAAEATLFQARNAFDGGYNDRAIALLLQLSADFNKLSLVERTELHYRLARVYDAQNNNEAAAQQYRYCTLQAPSATEGKTQRYLQAYSYFYWGELTKTTQPAIAKTHYKKALQIKDFFYQPSLESRAKAAIKQLK